MTARNIAWLAGLLEGEASFQMKNGCPSIDIQMCDRDVVERAAAMLGVERQGDSWTPKGKATYKPVFTARAHGVRAIQWMMTLYPLMGERRKEKIREIVMAWRQSKAAPRASRGTRFMANCHPTQPRTGNGLCRMCYMREYRRDYKRRRREAAA